MSSQPGTLTNPAASAFVVIAGGIDVCVPASIERMTTYVLREQEDWFEDEIRFLRAYLHRGMNVLDIGANFGVYALTMAQVVGPNGHVWAFEPASTTAAYLRASVAVNNMTNIDVIEMGVSDGERTATLYLNADAELNTLHAGGTRGGAAETVRLVSLDSYAKAFEYASIDFVKLDAEGEEANVIRGARRFFARHSPLVMFELKHGASVNVGLIRLFDDNGYKTYRYVPGLNMLVPFDAGSAPDAYQLNLFCCKDDRAARLEKDGWLVPRFPDTVTVPDDVNDRWRHTLAALPYAKLLMHRWTRADASNTVEDDRYYQALSYYLLAQEPQTPYCDRYALLQMSKWLLDALITERSTVPRLFSSARVSAEIGARGDAVRACAELIRLLAPGTGVELAAPFLAISRHFGDLEVQPSQLGQWLLASVVESHERLRAFSSYFTGADLVGNLDWLATTPFMTAAMERRRRLIRARAT